MYLQALTEKKKVWDSEHTLTLDMINNLENLYSKQDKCYDSSLRLFFV